ncbi:MAG: hypothetical protein ACAH17_02575 [Candidatus Paceibacterota bacterium]
MSTTLSKVLTYQHPALLRRIERTLGLSTPEARKLFENMLSFLYKAGTCNSTRLRPSKEVDEAWHEFILFTRDYAGFCYQHFGLFIHHAPDQWEANRCANCESQPAKYQPRPTPAPQPG